ncbi:MAG: dihydroorotase [Methylacidiphilales bacterium]|nr:dihydroorotase [Candidatus Methylacidiphilales bacterium]MDW8349772.1 dihydroorotase [Verrucomicrobiae bacterium]
MKKLIKILQGRIIDPSRGLDQIGDLYILEDRIIDPNTLDAAERYEIEEIPAGGKIVAPGLIDIHVHLREPGQTAKETIATGALAAAVGGYTTIVAMPNTQPVVDHPSVVSWVRQRAAETACVNVLPSACLSQGAEGERLAPMASLKAAGVVAFTDDGRCIQNNELMRRAMEYAAMLGVPVMDHCQDYSLTQGAVMHEGEWSVRLGLRGWPSIAEEIIVARNILLCEMTGARVHCQHLSSAGSVRLIREARARGLPISAEVTPHHLSFTDAELRDYDTLYKVNPPLRTGEDRLALLEGVIDGTISILASDHAPHCGYEKEVEFDLAPFGMINLETQLAVYIQLFIESGRLSWLQLLDKLTTQPAALLGLKNKGTLADGADADVTIIDPHVDWEATDETFRSKSRNTPFLNRKFRGRAIRTIVAGKTVWDEGRG